MLPRYNLQQVKVAGSHLKCCLQIFKLDFSSNTQDLPVAGQAVNAPERFHRLSWNAFVFGTPEQEKYPVNCLYLASLHSVPCTACMLW